MRLVTVAINGILDLKNFYPVALELRTKHNISVDIIGHVPGLEALASSYDGLIVGSDWNQNRPIVEAFNQVGKPTVLLQSEGMFVDENQWYVGKTPVCGLSCVWGPEHLRIFVDRGYDGEVVVSGPPRFDIYYNFRPAMDKLSVYEALGLEDTNKPYLLYLGQFFPIQEFGPDLYNQQIEFTEFATTTDDKFYGIIKSHPQETPARFFSREDIIRRSGRENVKVIDQGGHTESVEIATLIHYAACVVTYSSTASIEARYLGRPTAIFCNLVPSPLNDGTIASFPSIRSQAELAAIIQDEAESDPCDKFISRFLPGEINGKFTSNASSSIAAFVKGHSKRRVVGEEPNIPSSISVLKKAEGSMEEANISDLEQEVERVKWWHPIRFSEHLYARSKAEYDALHDRADRIFKYGVEGKTVLDVGAWDGFYSIEAQERGAGHILATDKYIWEKGRKAGFDLVRKTIGTNISEKTIDPVDIDIATVGEFDVVLFLGVFYHLKNPFSVLENLSEITKEYLVLETIVDAAEIDKPAMVFYPGASFNKDATNWWGPNNKLIVSMLKECGFEEIVVDEYKTGRSIFHAFK